MAVLCVELRHVRCAETPVENATAGVFAQAAMTVQVSFAVNPEREMSRPSLRSVPARKRCKKNVPAAPFCPRERVFAVFP